MNNFIFGICCGVIIFAMVIAFFNIIETQPTITPNCPEDSVLIGTGEFKKFDGQYYWTHYVCGPAVDDFGG